MTFLFHGSTVQVFPFSVLVILVVAIILSLLYVITLDNLCDDAQISGEATVMSRASDGPQICTPKREQVLQGFPYEDPLMLKSVLVRKIVKEREK